MINVDVVLVLLAIVSFMGVISRAPRVKPNVLVSNINEDATFDLTMKMFNTGFLQKQFPVAARKDIKKDYHHYYKNLKDESRTLVTTDYSVDAIKNPIRIGTIMFKPYSKDLVGYKLTVRIQADLIRMSFRFAQSYSYQNHVTFWTMRGRENLIVRQPKLRLTVFTDRTFKFVNSNSTPIISYYVKGTKVERNTVYAKGTLEPTLKVGKLASIIGYRSEETLEWYLQVFEQTMAPVLEYFTDICNSFFK